MGRRVLDPELGPGNASRVIARLSGPQADWVYQRAALPKQSVGKVIRDLVELAMAMEQAQIRGWKLGLADKARQGE